MERTSDGIKRNILKEYFKVDGSYRFEWNDLRALLQLVNVCLIFVAGWNVGAIFGLIIASIGLLKDLFIDRHINGMALHLLGMALNLFVLIG